jgi:hypothetical protein
MAKHVTVGEAVFSGIKSNPYLNELYGDILYNYSLLLLRNETITPREVNISHSLQFADVLSKSIDATHVDLHRIWAQEIVALLDKLHPDNEMIQHYLGSVLSNTGNYRGLDLRAPGYLEASVLDRIYMEFSKDMVSIPAEPDKQFFRAQMNVYEHLKDNSFSYSGPTSMGKSFVIRMFIKEQVIKEENHNFCLLVPTKALINEVTSKIINDLKELISEHNYRVVTSAGDLGLKQNRNFILVLTPERLLYLLLSNPNIRIDYLFIDEAHKISSRDSRSAFYYKVVDMLASRTTRPRIVFSSPNIPNPDVYLRLIPDIADDSKALTTLFAPVSQFKYLVDTVEKRIQLFNNHTNELVDIPSDISSLSLSEMVLRIGEKSQNIVYCSSTDKPVEYALDYAKFFTVSGDKNLESLSNEIKAEIHGDYFLAELIRKGIAYHIGYLPASIRLRIEELYKSGAIHTVFCTSTLVEGVNLPADNLFITSYHNGRPEMTAVDFKNLIGRVGRIEYGLYGNVFLVRLEDRIKIEKFTNLLKQEVPAQKLSIVSELSLAQKKKIVECLQDGNIELLKHPSNQSEDSFALMRKFAIILLRDIVVENNSIVRRAFEDLLTPVITSKIKIAFESKNQTPDDDINVSVDQTNNLTQAILKGLQYPKLKDDNTVDYNRLMDFLERLCEIFKWDKYESATLGKRSRETDKHGMLRWYGVILAQWISGNGLSMIITRSLEYKRDNPKTNVKIDGQQIEYNHSLPRHRNTVIADTLKVIENIILFRISNYFLRFSEEYKKIRNIKEFDNDWYEYVEYGTTNRLTIFLQRNGFSRETATYVKAHRRDYVVESDKGIRLRSTILSSGSQSVRREVAEIKYNVPELFVN